MIRYEAVRAWTRRAAATHGCQPLLDALSDRSLHVVLAAIDALGDQCRDEPSITDRIVSEARTPPPMGRWQREAHAFVALAKRDRQRAGISMLTFASHNVWQVRMYAARAAAITEMCRCSIASRPIPTSTSPTRRWPALRQKSGPASDATFIDVLQAHEQNRRPQCGRPSLSVDQDRGADAQRRASDDRRCSTRSAAR